MGLIRDIYKLEPNTRYNVVLALAELDLKGIKYFINETLRLQQTQYCYWLQGRGNPLELVNYFRTLSGLWTIGELDNQKQITQTVQSKHIIGKAIDIVPSVDGKSPNWNAPIADYQKIASVMKSHGMNWGGDWKSFQDNPHYELAE